MTDAEHPEGFDGNEGEPDSPYMWTEFIDEEVIYHANLADAILLEADRMMPGYEPRHLLWVDDSMHSQVSEALFSAMASLRRDTGTRSSGVLRIINVLIPASKRVIDLASPNVPFVFLQLETRDGGDLLTRPILTGLEKFLN